MPLLRDRGDVLIKVEPTWAPEGADRFLAMVNEGYLADMALYRSVPNFLVQFGLRKEHASYNRFCAASIPDDQSHQMQVRRGMLAFAGHGKDSRACQFFVSYTDDAASLGTQPWETPFAHVVEGLEEVVAQWTTEYGDMPPWGTGPSPQRLQNEGNPYVWLHPFGLLRLSRSRLACPAEALCCWAAAVCRSATISRTWTGLPSAAARCEQPAASNQRPVLAVHPPCSHSPLCCCANSAARVVLQVVPLSEVGLEHHDSPDGVHQEGAGRRKRDHGAAMGEEEL
jgi:peptidyl-prolyl cis-trans isomerase A (cyclophilin A)